MSSVNLVILLGRIGKPVELKYAPSGMAIATFSLATSEKIKGDEKTCWHNIKAFGKTAEALNTYTKKGSQLHIVGRIDNRDYEQDGVKKYFSEVVINTFQFMDSKNSDAPAPQTAPVQAKPNLTPEFDTSFSANDIPFSKVEFC